MLSKEKIECKWLNKKFGKGFYLCNAFLLPVTKEICINCKERSDKNVK